MSDFKLKQVTDSFLLKDHVYHVLRKAITEMHIYTEQANLRLDERSLAEQLNISRTPVREALMLLEQQGFVQVQPRRGVFVVRKTMDEILEMIIVWAALESMAALLVTERATDRQIASLRKLAADQSVSGEAALEEYSDANIRFHQKILELSRCKALSTIAEDQFVHMQAVRRRAMREGDRRTRSVVDHIEIIEALEARDGARASDLVRSHTMRLHDHVRRTWQLLEGHQRARDAANETG